MHSFCEHSVDLPHSSVGPLNCGSDHRLRPSNRKARREYGFSFKLPRLYLANTLLTRKTNGWAIGFLRWTRELVKHIKDNSKALVILMFKLLKLTRQVFMTCNKLTQAHKSSYNLDAHIHCDG